MAHEVRPTTRPLSTEPAFGTEEVNMPAWAYFIIMALAGTGTGAILRLIWW